MDTENKPTMLPYLTSEPCQQGGQRGQTPPLNFCLLEASVESLCVREKSPLARSATHQYPRSRPHNTVRRRSGTSHVSSADPRYLGGDDGSTCLPPEEKTNQICARKIKGTAQTCQAHIAPEHVVSCRVRAQVPKYVIASKCHPDYQMRLSYEGLSHARCSVAPDVV